MKWVRKFENWKQNSTLIEQFNLLYRPLGLWLTTKAPLRKDDTISLNTFKYSFNININFNTEDTVFGYFFDTAHRFRNEKIYPVTSNNIKLEEISLLFRTHHIDHENDKFSSFRAYGYMPSYVSFFNKTQMIYTEQITDDKENNLISILIGYVICICEHICNYMMDSGQKIESDIIKNIVIKYSKYLLENLPNILFENPNYNYLYKAIYEVITSSPNIFKYLRKLKNTTLYNELQKIGDIDKFTNATEMGDMGF